MLSERTLDDWIKKRKEGDMPGNKPRWTRRLLSTPEKEAKLDETLTGIIEAGAEVNADVVIQHAKLPEKQNSKFSRRWAYQFLSNHQYSNKAHTRPQPSKKSNPEEVKLEFQKKVTKMVIKLKLCFQGDGRFK